MHRCGQGVGDVLGEGEGEADEVAAGAVGEALAVAAGNASTVARRAAVAPASGDAAGGPFQQATVSSGALPPEPPACIVYGAAVSGIMTSRLSHAACEGSHSQRVSSDATRSPPGP